MCYHTPTRFTTRAVVGHKLAITNKSLLLSLKNRGKTLILRRRAKKKRYYDTELDRRFGFFDRSVLLITDSTTKRYFDKRKRG